jgi:hypothetical protein
MAQEIAYLRRRGVVVDRRRFGVAPRRRDLRAAALVEGLPLVDVLRPRAAVELRFEDVCEHLVVERPSC